VGKSKPNEVEKNGGKNDSKIIFRIFCGNLGAVAGICSVYAEDINFENVCQVVEKKSSK